MATATAERLDEAKIAALEPWDDEDLGNHTTPMHGVASVAWQVLMHSQEQGPDIARVKRMPLAPDMDAEDMHGFLFDLVERAAEIAYVASKIDRTGFELPWDRGRVTVEDMGRAVAALMRIDVVDDETAFDLDYRAKRDAENRTPAG